MQVQAQSTLDPPRCNRMPPNHRESSVENNHNNEHLKRDIKDHSGSTICMPGEQLGGITSHGGDVNQRESLDWQMNMVIVPSHADEGSPIDMFTGINTSSVILNQERTTAGGQSESSSYFASNGDLAAAVEVREAEAQEAALIARLQGSECRSIQDSYDVIFAHLVEGGFQAEPQKKQQKDKIVVKFMQ